MRFVFQLSVPQRRLMQRCWARDIVIHMLSKRPDIREEMIKAGFRVGVMAESEMTTDLPEQRNWKKPPAPANLTAVQKARYDKLGDNEYWDNRAHGMGRYTTCAEENLLGYHGAKYYREHICVHEFSHAIMSGIRIVDPKLHEDIRKAYADAMAGHWKGQYGSTNASEYWAEATQTWFWSNFEFKDGDKTIVTPDDLKEDDPEIYEILSPVYADHHITLDVFHSMQIPQVSVVHGRCKRDGQHARPGDRTTSSDIVFDRALLELHKRDSADSKAPRKNRSDPRPADGHAGAACSCRKIRRIMASPRCSCASVALKNICCSCTAIDSTITPRGSWTADEVAGITGGRATLCIPAQQTISCVVRC